MGLDLPNFKNEYDINLIQRYEQFKNNVDKEQEKLLNLGERVNYLRRKKVVFCSENRNKEVVFTGISEWFNEKILFIRKNELENKLESIDDLDQRIDYLKTHIINEKIEFDGYSSTQKYDYWVKYDDSSLKGYDKEKADIYQNRQLAIQEDKKDRKIESEKLIQWICLKIESMTIIIDGIKRNTGDIDEPPQSRFDLTDTQVKSLFNKLTNEKELFINASMSNFKSICNGLTPFNKIEWVHKNSKGGVNKTSLNCLCRVLLNTPNNNPPTKTLNELFEINGIEKIVLRSPNKKEKDTFDRYIRLFQNAIKPPI